MFYVRWGATLVVLAYLLVRDCGITHCTHYTVGWWCWPKARTQSTGTNRLYTVHQTLLCSDNSDVSQVYSRSSADAPFSSNPIHFYPCDREVCLVGCPTVWISMTLLAALPLEAAYALHLSVCSPVCPSCACAVYWTCRHAIVPMCRLTGGGLPLQRPAHSNILAVLTRVCIVMEGRYISAIDQADLDL